MRWHESIDVLRRIDFTTLPAPEYSDFKQMTIMIFQVCPMVNVKKHPHIFSENCQWMPFRFDLLELLTVLPSLYLHTHDLRLGS